MEISEEDGILSSRTQRYIAGYKWLTVTNEEVTATDDGSRQRSATGAIYGLYTLVGEVAMECCVHRTNRPSGRVRYAGTKRRSTASFPPPQAAI